MLWLAHSTRHRFTLQVRTSERTLQVWDASQGRWNGNYLIAGSSTAIVHLDQDGRLFDLRSRNGYSQRVIFFDATRGHSVGSIEVNASGAFMIRKGVEGAFVDRNWPALWTTQTVAIVRIRAPIEIYALDRLGGGGGTVTYDPHHTTWHVPSVFWERTRNYDIGDDGDDVRADPTRLPPAIGLVPAAEIDTPANNVSTPTRTPTAQRRAASRAVSRAGSIASTTSGQPAPNQSGNREKEEDHRTMPALIDRRTQNNSVSGTASQHERKSKVYEYASTAGLQVKQPDQSPQAEAGIDFDKWWPNRSDQSQLNSGTQENQPMTSNTEASEFRVVTKADGKEGLVDNIGEIKWITDDDMRGAHFTAKLRRAYRHVTGFCPHCMS